MEGISVLFLHLLLWVGLLVISWRMLVTALGPQLVRPLKRIVAFIFSGWLWLLSAPFRFLWALARLRFQRGRPLLRVHGANVVDIAPPVQRSGNDRDVFHPRRRRRT